MQATIEGRQYAIGNAGGQLHALDGACPHRQGPLGEGALHGTTLVCPWHAWEFNCETEENTLDAILKQQKHEVVVEGDDIVINTP